MRVTHLQPVSAAKLQRAAQKRGNSARASEPGRQAEQLPGPAGSRRSGRGGGHAGRSHAVAPGLAPRDGRRRGRGGGSGP